MPPASCIGSAGRPLDRPIGPSPSAPREEGAGAARKRHRPLLAGSWLAADGVADAGELVGDVAAEGLQSGDGDHGDEGQEQAVLDHAGATLVAVELGKHPGLQNEQVHLLPPPGAPVSAWAVLALPARLLLWLSA